MSRAWSYVIEGVGEFFLAILSQRPVVLVEWLVERYDSKADVVAKSFVSRVVVGETMGAGDKVWRRVSFLAVDLVALDIFGVF